MSPRSWPPGQGCGSWGWALSQVQHSPVLWLKVGKGAEAGAGRELGESRTSDEDDRGPSPWPEGEGLWHISGRQVSASALAPFSLGHLPLGQLEHSHSFLRILSLLLLSLLLSTLSVHSAYTCLPWPPLSTLSTPESLALCLGVSPLVMSLQPPEFCYLVFGVFLVPRTVY